MAKSKAKPPALVATQKAAAAALEITPRVLRMWQAESWFPPAGRAAAGYDLAAIRAARDAMGRKGSAEAAAARAQRFDNDGERLKQGRFETRRRELQLQEIEGELISRRAVELHFAALLTALGDWCDALPDLIAGDFPKKQQAKLRRRLREELDRKRNDVRADLSRQARDLQTG